MHTNILVKLSYLYDKTVIGKPACASHTSTLTLQDHSIHLQSMTGIHVILSVSTAGDVERNTKPSSPFDAFVTSNQAHG